MKKAKKNLIPTSALAPRRGLAAVRIAAGIPDEPARPSRAAKDGTSVPVLYRVRPEQRDAIYEEAMRRATLSRATPNQSEVLREMLDDALTGWLAKARAR